MSVVALIGTDAPRVRAFLQSKRSIASDWMRLQASEVSPPEVFQPSLFATAEAPALRIVDGYAAWKPAQRKAFAELAGAAGDEMMIVVLCKQLSANDPLSKALDEDRKLDFSLPKSGHYLPWIHRQAKLRGLTLDRQAAAELLRRAGEKTETLNNELDKLSLLGESISIEAVKGLTADQSVGQAWGWVQAMCERDLHAAIRELSRCERDSLAPLMLSGSLHSRIILVAQASLGISAEQSHSKDYPFRQARQLLGRWNREQLLLALAHLVDLEAGLKGTSAASEWNQMLRFTQRWCQIG